LFPGLRLALSLAYFHLLNPMLDFPSALAAFHLLNPILGFLWEKMPVKETMAR
jgi:hypothetical protein